MALLLCECHLLQVNVVNKLFKLNVVMLIVVILSVVMLSVVMLNVIVQCLLSAALYKQIIEEHFLVC